MLEALSPLALGLLGSAHCLGMCGPLVLAYAFQGGGETPTSGLARHLAFHAGRLSVYGGAGAAAGWLFAAADRAARLFELRGAATLVSGAVMVLLGLALLGAVRVPACFAAPSGAVFRRLVAGGRGSGLLLGAASGCLPCCLSWAALVGAAAAGSAARGAAAMLLFGLGTVPALVSAGTFASVLGVRWRLAGGRITALAVLGMGAILIARGAGALA